MSIGAHRLVADLFLDNDYMDSIWKRLEAHHLDKNP